MGTRTRIILVFIFICIFFVLIFGTVVSVISFIEKQQEAKEASDSAARARKLMRPLYVVTSFLECYEANLTHLQPRWDAVRGSSCFTSEADWGCHAASQNKREYLCANGWTRVGDVFIRNDFRMGSKSDIAAIIFDGVETDRFIAAHYDGMVSTHSIKNIDENTPALLELLK